MKPTIADWRAQVDKELAGKPFEALIAATPEGLAIDPLYVDGPTATVRGDGARFGVCMRASSDDEARAELDGGADAVWVVGDSTFASARAHVIAGDELRGDRVRTARVSTLRIHQAGADAADELAYALSTAVARLADGAAAESLWFQVSVGRDTFGELCKLRALRILVAKLVAAANHTGEQPPIHAVCSTRTLSQRDPWTNILRVTTQVFAAALGGARYVTPERFDSALGASSAHAGRVARNTALVLRDESHLGRVVDAAGGSYYLESRTELLARLAWSRFQDLERGGGIRVAAVVDALHARIEATWRTNAAAIGKRKVPILGVSEFANLDEILPAAIVEGIELAGLPRHRDAEGFEALRTRAEAAGKRVTLVTLGAPAEHRGRVGYATALFATAGVRVTVDDVAGAEVAVLCGSDERYTSEAVARAAELHAAGVRHVILAGRPGPIEAELRAVGVGTFIYVGCDALTTLTELLT